MLGRMVIMKRVFVLLLPIVFIVSSACKSSVIMPYQEETIDFDLTTAIEIVEAKEKIVIELGLKERITPQQYEDYKKLFIEEFGLYGEDLMSIFVLNQMEDGFLVQQNAFYPTVFHEGVSVTKAVIHNIYYENEFFNRTYLRIQVEYEGSDPNLSGWKRGYVLVPGQNGEWEIQGFSGRVNFVGAGYHMGYLELKK